MKKFFKDCIKSFEFDAQTVIALALANFNNRF